MKKKLIVDSVPGIDDAIAIVMALASPQLDVLGLTSVFGNVTTDVVTRNALAVLEAVSRSDIPVAAGAQGPIDSAFLGPASHVHGENGLGNATISSPLAQSVAESAVDFMYSLVRSNPGEVTLLALGPLTNLAELVSAHPAVVDLGARCRDHGWQRACPWQRHPRCGSKH